MFYAHSAPTHSAPTREAWEPLADHLRDVAERAAAFASAFGAAEEARLAGLLHDLGKYSDLFTLRLDGKERGLDHWSAGASAALLRFRENGFAAALAIQGHHVGLQNLESLYDLRDLRPLAEHHPLGLRLTSSDFAPLLERLAADGLALPAPEGTLFRPKDPSRAAGMLDVRMLFSALVDADFLETEAHFQRGPDGRKVHREDGPPLQPAAALARLEAHLARVAADSPATPEVNRLRSDLLQACLDAALLPPGLFTLTAPTGAGKTLAMLAFALRHAQTHGMRRVVVAVPFLSIIEQTVRVYREILDDGRYVLEHHSLAGLRSTEEQTDGQSAADRAARLQAENWDAPLVVTTSVQLLESLFANRPAACRKLHRLAGSVILLDEVQTLPPALAAATLATLSHLSRRYGASVVFATATQPAFESLDDQVRELAASGWKPREIAPPALRLFERARRTRVEWDLETPRSWDSLAAELTAAGSALCIVNLKRHAQALAERLHGLGAPGLLHLSTNLCPTHRERVLAEVRHRLDRGLPCLLISTQCVEAGVDVDFPLVFRALAPLEAIAQAAGRCNRNGRMPDLGIVRVFVPEEERYPPGLYESAARITRALYRESGPAGLDLQDPAVFDLYYRAFYSSTGVDSGEKIRKTLEIKDAITKLCWDKVAGLYRLIDKDAVNVVVPDDPERFEALRRDLRRTGHPTAAWIRRARSLTVNLYRPDDLLPYLQPASPPGPDGQRADWFLLTDDGLYDRTLLGLTAAPDVWIA